jgi:aspartyl aminopeptidase
VTRYRELDLTADSFSDTLMPGQVKFYGITITQAWLEKKLDLVVRVHVEKGYARKAVDTDAGGVGVRWCTRCQRS